MPVTTARRSLTPTTLRTALSQRARAGDVDRVDDGLGADAADEPGEDPSRADLHEVGDAAGRHALHAGRPLHAVDEVLGQLAAQALRGLDDRCVDVAEHRDLRVAERDLGQDASELVARAAHERRVAGHAHRQAHRLARADGPAHLEREDEGRDDPGEHDLAGRVLVGDADLAVLAGGVDDLVRPARR